MIWLTWRQHRVEIVIMGLILLLFALALLATRINIPAEAQQAGCASHTDACSQAQGAMYHYVNVLTRGTPFFYLCFVLPYILPVLAGVFIGAPALSREFEQGTYRLAWAQGIPWSRWFFQKTGFLFGVVACAFAILFGIFSWWSASLSISLSGAVAETWTSTFIMFFDTWGAVIVAYAVFAVALGLFWGTVTRKPVVAMAITLVMFTVVRVLIANDWRPYYLPPVVSITPFNMAINVPPGSWIINEGGGSTNIIDRYGHPVSLDALPPDCENADNACLARHGFRDWLVYQPADRYWLFLGIESGIYLLFAAILIALTYAWTKYRIIGRERRPLSPSHPAESLAGNAPPDASEKAADRLCLGHQ